MEVYVNHSYPAHPRRPGLREHWVIAGAPRVSSAARRITATSNHTVFHGRGGARVCAWTGIRIMEAAGSAPSRAPCRMSPCPQVFQQFDFSLEPFVVPRCPSPLCRRSHLLATREGAAPRQPRTQARPGARPEDAALVQAITPRRPRSRVRLGVRSRRISAVVRKKHSDHPGRGPRAGTGRSTPTRRRGTSWLCVALRRALAGGIAVARWIARPLAQLADQAQRHPPGRSRRDAGPAEPRRDRRIRWR